MKGNLHLESGMRPSCAMGCTSNARCAGMTHASRSRTWSKGQMKGSLNLEGGMRPSCGAHHLSAPHHMGGMITILPSALATASACLTCKQGLLKDCEDWVCTAALTCMYCTKYYLGGKPPPCAHHLSAPHRLGSTMTIFPRALATASACLTCKHQVLGEAVESFC